MGWEYALWFGGCPSASAGGGGESGGSVLEPRRLWCVQSVLWVRWFRACSKGRLTFIPWTVGLRWWQVRIHRIRIRNGKTLEGLSCPSHLARWRSSLITLNRWKSPPIGPCALHLNNQYAVLNTLRNDYPALARDGSVLLYAKLVLSLSFFLPLTYWNLPDIRIN